MKSHTRRPHIFIFVLLLFFGACSDSPDDEGPVASKALRSADGLLRYIPADSPYVAAAAEPLPDDVRDELQRKSSRVIEAYANMLRVSLSQGVDRSEQGGNEEAEASDMPANASVEPFIAELTTLITPEGMESAGIDRHLTAALYGYGLWPVLRIKLSDEARMEATLSRLEEETGEKLATAALGGESYRYAESDGEMRVVIAVLDGYLVAGLVPADPPEALLKSVLGIEPPDSSIADSGALADLAEKYAYTPYGLAYLDTRRVADAFLGDPADVNGQMLSEIGLDASDVSDTCREELRSIAAIAPRIASGYTEFSADRIASHVVVELRSDIATGLATLTAAVPGLGQKGQAGLFSFGMSFNPQAARDFYAARLDALEADPYECEWFAGLQDSVAEGREMLAQPLPPIVYSFRGFLAAIDNISGMDIKAGKPPTDVDMRLLVATDNAEALVAMGAMFSPEIAALDLQPDGQPVSLPVPPGLTQVREAHVAMSDSALALSSGLGGGKRLPSMLAAPVAEPSPFMSTDIDAAAYYGFIADTAMWVGDDDSRSPEFQEAFRDTMSSLQELVRRISVDMYFTERGIEFPSTVELVD